MSEGTPVADFPLPPATFSFLVESILMQAQIQLGLLHLGEEDEAEQPEPNLPFARHSIDTLAMLQDKTKGNLTIEEQRLLENGLTELRFRFVEVADRLKQNLPGAVEAPQADPSRDEPKENRPLIVTSDGGKGTKTS